MASTPRRHHFVPRWYLRRFAQDDKVLVRRRDSTVFSASTVNVAVEGGFYDVLDQEGRKSPVVERAFGDIDGAAAAVIQTIDATGTPPPAGSDDRLTLSVYLSLQLSRTPETRERVLFPRRVSEYANGREVTLALVTEYLESVHLGFRPRAKEAEAAFDWVTTILRDPQTQTDDFAVRSMLMTVEAAAPLLASLNWTIEVERKNGLITSDTPLVLWRAPTPRDALEGVGIRNAEELRFALDPGKQLVLSKRPRTPTARITAERARSCSADAAAACYQFVIGRPDQRRAVEALALAQRRPVLRFNIGPMREVLSDGTTRDGGEVLHLWVPRR